MIDQTVGIAKVANLKKGVKKVSKDQKADENAEDIERQRIGGSKEKLFKPEQHFVSQRLVLLDRNCPRLYGSSCVGRKPRLLANTIACARVQTPNLSKTFET